MLYGWKSVLKGLVSALLFALVVSFLFQNLEIAIVITISLVLHELGHIAVVQAMGIRWEFGFSALGAWTRTPLQQRRAIGDFSNAIIHLSGPFFSFLISILSLVVFFLLKPEAGGFFWLRMVNFNILLAATNLVPIGSLSDGGKFFNRISSSLSPQSRRKMLLNFLPIFLIIGEHLVNFDESRLASLVLLVLWILFMFFVHRQTEETDHLESEKKMSEKQAGILVSGVIILILYCYAVTVITPFWLTEADVLHMVAAIEKLILFLIQ